MRKTILIIGVFAIFSSFAVAQTKNDTILQLQQQVENLEKLNSTLIRQVEKANASIRRLESKINTASDSIASMKQELTFTNSGIREMSEKLEQQINQLSDKTDSGFSEADIRIKHNTVIFILIAIIAILLIPVILIMWFGKRLASLKKGLSAQMEESTGEIREEINKLDNQVFWSLDMLKGSDDNEQKDVKKQDHSLALKVADEIIRIQKNINAMDPDTKGLKQMEFALERIRDNFRDNGYEIVDMLNKPYNEGMLVTAKFIKNENLQPGDKIITRIIKPQVKYNDTIIQDAEVEVSTG
jgi:peptidoglycan hydrolase CwlO-like protein